jgi:hypothetical protein
LPVSSGPAKPIRLSNHARGYLARRGFTETEVEQVIRTAGWRRTRGGRWEASLEFPYNRTWNGTTYATKKVRPIFVEEATEIVVVTVYTYYYN